MLLRFLRACGDEVRGVVGLADVERPQLQLC